MKTGTDERAAAFLIIHYFTGVPQPFTTSADSPTSNLTGF